MLKLVFLFVFSAFLVSCGSTPPPAPDPSKAPVILVHGMISTNYRMATIEKQLRNEGYPVLNPNLRPSDGSAKIETLATQLKSRIEKEYGRTQPLHFVGHSMGGLISRYYLEEMGGAKRGLSLQTIATPHYGTPLSHLHPGPAGVQMRPGSNFLRSLNAGSNNSYPETSYHTRADLLVPYRNSIRPNALNITIPSIAHHSVPKHPDLVKHVSAQISKAETRGRHTRH